MKVNEIIKFLESYCPDFDDPETCDTVKTGSADNEITKVAVTMFATPNVIREAAARGANLLVVHEPTFYDHMDEVVKAPFLTEKKKELINELGLTIYRTHDRIHYHDPDIITEGTLKMSGLKGTYVKGKYVACNRFILDEPMTAREIAIQFEDKLGVEHIRIAGELDKPGKVISCRFGDPENYFEEMTDPEVDFMFSGEICEWDEGELARDYSEFGYNKAIIVLSHIISERCGMMLVTEQMQEAFPDTEIFYLESGSVYKYAR